MIIATIVSTTEEAERQLAAATHHAAILKWTAIGIIAVLLGVLLYLVIRKLRSN